MAYINLDIHIKNMYTIKVLKIDYFLTFLEVNMESIVTYIGHILGFISVGLFCYSYQRTKKDKLLIIQTAATALSCVQYLLIGAFSGFALNVVCIIRNFIYFQRDKKQRADWMTPVILSVCMAVVSIFSWEGAHSLFITLGLVVNTICMGMFGAQNFRKTILISSTLILAYNVFAHSYSGMLSESISLISVIIGIVRFSRVTKPVKAPKIQTIKPVATL